jgi:hypothetical protein
MSISNTLSSIVTIVFLCVVVYLIQWLSIRYKDNHLYTYVISIVGALLIFVLFKYVLTTNVDNFRFEVSPCKECSSVYMMDPVYREKCEKLGCSRNYNCGIGYSGRPMRSTGCNKDIVDVSNSCN